ncbi:MAG: type II toxin-antitoxin system VapC family toxin [Methanobrevibacter sp.]|jgi:predicted nucleic acid-binding protein|nr:type II toxin-antitoxin system VapC family toxin [Methanobrevibacter sp.]
MIFLDASFLISLIVNDHKNFERAKKIYKKIENEEKIISKLVITEVITVLDSNLKVDEELLKSTYKYLNEDFQVIDDYPFFNQAFDEVLNQNHLGFFDCMYISLMKILEINKIASFDKAFNKIKELTVIS